MSPRGLALRMRMDDGRDDGLIDGFHRRVVHVRNSIGVDGMLGQCWPVYMESLASHPFRRKSGKAGHGVAWVGKNSRFDLEWLRESVEPEVHFDDQLNRDRVALVHGGAEFVL